MARYIAPLVIRDIMTSRPRTVGRKTSLRTLLHLFTAYWFNGFPVVDETESLVGIVTKLDLLRIFRHDPQRLLPELGVLWAERVNDIMRRRVVTLAPEESVVIAVDRMLSSRLRSLPVVEIRNRRNVLVGIVSRGDVLGTLVLENNAAR